VPERIQSASLPRSERHVRDVAKGFYTAERPIIIAVAARGMRPLHRERGVNMILGKIWHAIQAQFNKLANFLSGYDPVAEMQLEYDKLVAQIKEGLRDWRSNVCPGYAQLKSGD
jgi:hypothetical protein